MKLKENLKHYAILIIGVSLILLSSVYAGRDGHVSIFRNSGKCGGQNCETVYNVCGAGETLRLDLTNGYFTYRSDVNAQLRTNTTFVEGRNFVYWVNDTESFSCAGVGNTTTTCQREIWRELTPFDKTITPTECIKLRVTGDFDKQKYAWIDNVLNLLIAGTTYNYTEFISWNASNVTVFYEFNQSLNDSSGNNNALREQSSDASSPLNFNTTIYKLGNASWHGCPQTVNNDCSALNTTPTGIPLGNANFSISIWAYMPLDTAFGTGNRLWGMGYTGNDQNFKHIGLTYATDAPNNRTAIAGRGFSFTQAISLNQSTWYNYVVTYNSSDKNVQLWLNGNPIDSQIIATALDICIGTNNAACAIMLADYTNQPNVQASWSGILDDFRIYTQVLNSTQIRNLYNGSNGWGLLSLDGDNAVPPPVTNTAPNMTLSTMPVISPSAPTSDNTLNCTFTPFDAENTTIFANITWTRAGLNNNSFDARVTCTNNTACGSSTLVSSPLQPNIAWTCTARLDEGGAGTGLNSSNFTSASVTILNTAPNVTTVAINATTAVRYDSLNCSATPRDAYNTTLTANFSWYKGGALQFIANSTCTSGTQCFTSRLMPSINKSEVFVCGVNIFDGDAWSNETNGSSLTVSNTAPNITASNFSNLTGTYINTTLLANTTYTDLDADTGTVFFNWSVNGAVKRRVNFTSVANGTVLNDTFTTGNYTRGDVILLNVSANDGTIGSNTEVLTRTVLNYGPLNTTSVLNVSSAVTGDRINCSTTPSDPENATVLVNFSWYKNGAQDLTLANQVSCTNSTQCTASKIAINVNESESWFCRTTVFDGDAWSNFTNSSVLTVSNSAPAMQSLTPTTGTFYTSVSVSVACNATDIDTTDDITYDISGLFRTLSQGSQSWQSIVTSDADGLFTWDITNLAGQSGVDLNCSASDGTVSNLSFNPAGTLTIDRAPNITLVNVSPEVSALTNQTLNCSATVVDDIATSMNVNFTWYNGLVINTSDTVSCGNNTLCNGTGIPSSNTSRAQNWTCAVIVTDGVSNASSVNDSVLIINSPPNVESVTIFPTPIQPNTKLNCSAAYIDLDADLANITFAFYKNGVLQSQNGTTVDVVNGTTANSSNTQPASGVSGGDIWTCSAQAKDVGGNDSVRLTTANSSVNNAPQINNITTIPANLSSVIGSTAYWIVNVTDSDNDLSFCNLTLRWPNQSIVASFDSVNMTKSATGDLWNSSSLTISVGGFYNASINCSDGAQNQTNVSLKSAVQTTINQTGTNYSTIFFSNSQFKINYSTDDQIVQAYVNITWPNGTIVNYSMTTVHVIPNKTYAFNTTNITLTQIGTYSLRFFGLAGTGENNITTTSFDSGSSILSSPDSVVTTPDPRQSLTLITLAVWQESVINMTYNFSGRIIDGSGNIMNTANFSFNFSVPNLSITGPKTLNNSDTVLVQINASSIIPDGLYTGNITITRLNDSAVNNIPIIIGINPPAGKASAVTATGGTTPCSGTVCDWRPSYTVPNIVQSNSFFIKNTGNFTLSNCQVLLSDDLANASWISVEETQGFSISINQTVTRNLLIRNPPSGSWFGYFDTKCQSTALGYNDSISSNTSNQPKVFVSVLFAAGSVGEGGAGGGGAVRTVEVVLPPINASAIVAQVVEELGEICGNGVCGGSENPLGCSQDCKVNVDSILCVAGPNCTWRQAWLAKGVVFGIVGVITYLTFFAGVIK